MNLSESILALIARIMPGYIGRLILVIVAAIMVLLSWTCSKEDETEAIACNAKLCIDLKVQMQIFEKYPESKSTCNTSDFKVIICNAAGETVRSYDKASDLPSEIELSPGDYYIVAYSGNPVTASFENPYYEGRSEIIILNANEFKTIQVNCTLANCAVAVVYSDYVKNNYSAYYTEIYAGTEKLIYDMNETRLGYCCLQPLRIKSTLTYTLPNGSKYNNVLEGTISAPEKGKLYEINIDTEITNGYSALNITLDESVEKQIVLLNDTTSTALRYGDLLITEIMYDPVALSDADGEWIELYNNSPKDINLLNLVLGNSTARHTISSDILLSPGEFFVLAKKDTAVDVQKYVYGSGISLTNTTGTVSISTYGSDGTDGMVIASLTYDNGASFPKAAGASLSLNPSCFDADKAKSGSSWCPGNVAYNTGDLGTPGFSNSICE
ncbi:MAG: DUF4493 domain-containing protein [Bacteroidales bacterium]|nr:DUF4493 domain-containing protein [Bacteroidales bacterium]